MKNTYQYLIKLVFLSIFFFNNAQDINISKELTKIIQSYKINSHQLFNNVNQPLNKENMTLLMYCAKSNCVHLSKLLINKMNADHLIRNSSNLTAYDIAKKEGHAELIKILKPKDLTIVGIAKYNDGIGRIPIGIIDCLLNDISINFINTVPEALIEEQKIEQTISNKILSILSSEYQLFNKVILFTDLLTTDKFIKKLATFSNRINLVYSMFESTIIPKEWANLLNKYIDAVIVPDKFFIEVYKNSGVNIPIFVLPLGIYLDEFLNSPIKTNKNEPFTFGCLSSFDPRKNHSVLIQAFAQEFKNNPNVVLKLNGRIYQNNELLKLIKDLKINNIVLSKENLVWNNYIETMKSFDCYINIPKGEGFSITPREALALGIPCIVTNNTAQTTICDSNCVRAVESNIKEKATYARRYEDLGFFFNCDVNQVRKAMRDVYKNYDYYLQKAHDGREWVKKYKWENLKQKYLNLVKPKKIIFGKKNKITNEFIMTNSTSLYNKYTNILNIN